MQGGRYFIIQNCGGVGTRAAIAGSDRPILGDFLEASNGYANELGDCPGVWRMRPRRVRSIDFNDERLVER